MNPFNAYLEREAPRFVPEIALVQISFFGGDAPTLLADVYTSYETEGYVDSSGSYVEGGYFKSIFPDDKLLVIVKDFFTECSDENLLGVEILIEVGDISFLVSDK